MDPTTERCPTAETLAAYLEGALPESEAKAISEHLGVCKYCEEVVDLSRHEP